MKSIDHILTLLKLIEEDCNGNYGLYHGKTGLAIAYYTLYATLNEEIYLLKAKSLIDELSENIGEVSQFDFKNGLTGIGWAIEWLVQNKFIDANTDEILEDIDDELYKSVIYMKSSELSVTNGTIGKALYFYRRLSARNPQTSRYRLICNQECIVLLIDEINDMLLDENYRMLFAGITLKLREIAVSLLFLARVNHLNLNAEISKRIICSIVEFSNKYFFSSEFNQSNNGEDDLYLIYSCDKAGKYLNDDCLTAMAANAYDLYNDKHLNRNGQSQLQEFIHDKLSHLSHTPLNEIVPLLNTLKPDIFSLLRSISLLPNTLEHNWEEGWGL
ncbi:lanthionine synthetase LanC family protein [Mucilaginibacter sp. X5P1]|uniref:lanthionine synthetase LanC family protein n=1 Tax=Mucilaginibacter sp. X5P1 TaxID=2723088 RepID=UPI0016223042|nr:lanthionine synthetase LanC family protein [Mucilaginibacter sp. X5P1]MBB6138282.1 hypothetical protein [Mucilaginibacter sp. X5P1]